VGISRVYVGAHNPLDVTAGFGIGVTVGSLLDLAVVARPRDRIVRAG
jgi:membrane-associated phospholipid phosphatase